MVPSLPDAHGRSWSQKSRHFLPEVLPPLPLHLQPSLFSQQMNGRDTGVKDRRPQEKGEG